jgi:hypothetical protein
MSFGPKAGPAAVAGRDDAAARVGTWAAQQAFELGRDSADREIAASLLGQNEAYRAPMEAAQEMAAYGEGGREHFGDPRAGDYPGREHEQEAGTEAEAG